MLTIEQLKEMKPRTIFEFKGGKNEERTFMWVAVRGGIHDWAIYTSLNAVPFRDFWAGDKEGIAKMGQKVHDEKMIKELVPCDDEAFEMYRH